MRINRALAALVLFAIGCGAGGLPAWKTRDLAPEERVKAHVVLGAIQITSPAEWDASPWARIGELVITPVFLAIDQQHAACFISSADWAIMHEGDAFVCPGRWILA